RDHPLDAELLVIGASWEACDEVVRDDVGARGARFGAARVTLGRLAGVLAAPALAAEGRVPASALSLDAVAAAAAAATPAPPLVGVPLLLLDVPIASAAEADLVAALAARAPAVLATV